MPAADPKSCYDKPAQSCDIVMKGGITSGVVYPLALVALAGKYRFANIGGTSAGAIAAAAAAAAEYGRPIKGAGFDRLARIPGEVGPSLLSLFQPTPVLKPVFDIFVAALTAKRGLRQVLAVASAAIRGYWLSALLGVLPGLVVTFIALVRASAGFVAFGLLLALVGLVIGLSWRLYRAATVDLVGCDFGVCPGISQPGSPKEAFTDWLARLIEEAAGPRQENKPLTFGDLAAPPNGAPPIRLEMMTTSLMEMRPYTLPLGEDDRSDRRFAFRRDEWDRIFPRAIMDYLLGVCARFETKAGEQGEFYHFPDPEHLPLIVAARMSLSFPGLIAAVPLWRCDFTLMGAEKNRLRRCLFSDGGLSSNFPIQFFDHLLPNSPTFAISLDDYDPKRSGDSIDDPRRPLVWLPGKADSGILIPVVPFEGIGGFLARLLSSAKDWQDNLQSVLPGYRERIVHVVLKPDQGGLNLTMTPETIETLVGYGKRAGELLCNDFDLDDHRWRRFLVSMARMEDTLDEVAAAYEQVPGRFGQFLDDFVRDQEPYRDPEPTTHHDVQYRQDTKDRVDEMVRRAGELVALGRRWRNEPTIAGGTIPRPPTHLRITPKY